MRAARAVLFDVRGTLVDGPEIDLGRRIARALGLGAEGQDAVSKLVIAHPFTSAHDLAERLQRELGLADEPTAVVRELWDAERVDLAEVSFAETCIAALGTAGAKIGIVADLSSPTADGFRIACPGIVSWVEAWTLSCEQGHTKPSPAIFQAALDALGVAPLDALMVGDSLEDDVVPALALGMGAVWLRRRDAGAAPVIAVDPHALPSPVSAEIVPKAVRVARTLSDVRRMALTWLWADRGRHGLTLPLGV